MTISSGTSQTPSWPEHVGQPPRLSDRRWDSRGRLSARNARMTMDASPRAWRKKGLRRHWAWLVLALTAIPAVWHVVDFEEDLDPEFPKVVRPTFSVVPPSAYRLAEPGDTLDR